MIFHRKNLPELELEHPPFVDGREIKHIKILHTSDTSVTSSAPDLYDWQAENLFTTDPSKEAKLAPVIGSIGLSTEVAQKYLRTNPGLEINLIQGL